MNRINIWDPVYCFPYVALAARYNDDSGDGDGDPFDYIDDIILKWLPEAVITKMPVTKYLDFTYSIEHDGRLLINFLGTEGKITEPGWESNFSAGIETPKFKKSGGHVDFIKTGETAARCFLKLVKKYGNNYLLAGHSRGGARCVAAARWLYKRTGAMPRHVIPYCSPPVFNHTAADEYDKSGLGVVTIRPVMYHDAVDALGLPFLKHVGAELKLPKLNTSAIKKRGIIGKLGYGHAYSSIFECLEYYCKKREMYPEMKWIKDTSWVAKI